MEGPTSDDLEALRKVDRIAQPGVRRLLRRREVRESAPSHAHLPKPTYGRHKAPRPASMKPSPTRFRSARSGNSGDLPSNVRGSWSRRPSSHPGRAGTVPACPGRIRKSWGRARSRPRGRSLHQLRRIPNQVLLRSALDILGSSRNSDISDRRASRLPRQWRVFVHTGRRLRPSGAHLQTQTTALALSVQLPSKTRLVDSGRLKMPKTTGVFIAKRFDRCIQDGVCLVV